MRLSRASLQQSETISAATGRAPGVSSEITMMRFLQITCFSLLCTAAAAASAVPNFALLDHEGRYHELDYYCRVPGVKGIVLFVQGNGCPLVQKRVPELKRLRDAYEAKGILFGMLNANLQDTREEIVSEAATYGMDFPILLDEAQTVAHLLEIDRTAEAILIKPEGPQVFYRGAIDDRLSYQKEKPEATEHYLRDAIDALLKEEAPPVASTEAPGCKITMGPSEVPSYGEQVAPILMKRCVTCHTKGGIGPFAMTSHRKVRGWSEMMAEVIATKQMPPWHADPHIGKFQEDQGLTPEETETVLAWIRAGSPRGEGPDPLEGYVPEQSEWRLGEPDHVLKLPKQEIPAEGVIDYRYVTVDTPFDKDVWLRGMEVNPDNTRVLHHVVVTGYPKGSKSRGRHEKWFTGYAPGTAAWPAPDGMGVRLPAGFRLKFQLHYTTSGKPERDETQIGFFLAEGPVEREVHTGVVIHPKFRIPPGDREYAESYERRTNKDITLYAMNPHMHYRGKRMSFHARLPDGSEQDLLSVPNYNFNWQRTYVLEEPVKLPKGSTLVIRNAWDNSALNPHNPDPTIPVTWGEQSFQEMFFATYQFTVDD